jgi:hypothetical protein
MERMARLLNRLGRGDLVESRDHGFYSIHARHLDLQGCLVGFLTLPYFCDPQNVLFGSVFGDDETETAVHRVRISPPNISIKSLRRPGVEVSFTISPNIYQPPG